MLTRLSLVVAFAIATRLFAADAPQIIHLLDRALVPDVAVDAKGIMHMVYGLGDHAWYVRSADNGATLTAPVKVNTEGKVSLTMGERGPKMSVGGDGVI